MPENATEIVVLPIKLIFAPEFGFFAKIGKISIFRALTQFLNTFVTFCGFNYNFFNVWFLNSRAKHIPKFAGRLVKKMIVALHWGMEMKGD